MRELRRCLHRRHRRADRPVRRLERGEPCRAAPRGGRARRAARPAATRRPQPGLSSVERSAATNAAVSSPLARCARATASHTSANGPTRSSRKCSSRSLLAASSPAAYGAAPASSAAAAAAATSDVAAASPDASASRRAPRKLRRRADQFQCVAGERPWRRVRRLRAHQHRLAVRQRPPQHAEHGERPPFPRRRRDERVKPRRDDGSQSVWPWSWSSAASEGARQFDAERGEFRGDGVGLHLAHLHGGPRSISHRSLLLITAAAAAAAAADPAHAHAIHAAALDRPRLELRGR